MHDVGSPRQVGFRARCTISTLLQDAVEAFRKKRRLERGVLKDIALLSRSAAHGNGKVLGEGVSMSAHTQERGRRELRENRASRIERGVHHAERKEESGGERDRTESR